MSYESILANTAKRNNGLKHFIHVKLRTPIRQDFFLPTVKTCENTQLECNDGACISVREECQYGLGCRDATHLRNCGLYINYSTSCYSGKLSQCLFVNIAAITFNRRHQCNVRIPKRRLLLWLPWSLPTAEFIVSLHNHVRYIDSCYAEWEYLHDSSHKEKAEGLYILAMFCFLFSMQVGLCHLFSF